MPLGEEMVNKNIKSGYSKNINSIDFEKKKTPGFDKKNQRIFLALVILGAIACLIYGFKSDDLLGGLVVAVAFLGVSLFFFFALKSRQNLEITYDGVIKHIEKQVEDYKKTRKYLRTLIVITADDGKEFIYNSIISSPRNDYTTYYKEGDKVRHHYGFDLPEKYDKSNDEKAVCILCGQLVDIENDNCTACGKILLK